MTTAVLVDPIYLEHETPPGHPERPDRLRVLWQWLDGYERGREDHLAPLLRLSASRQATLEQIGLVHSPHHIELIKATAGRTLQAIDPDTYTSPRSFDVALNAVGGLLDVIDAVMTGGADNGMALVRPPGHHAEPDRAMGFCLFNNIAIGARYLTSHYGLSRVAVIDWDVHHGNGTQKCFYSDADVLFLSTHQYPYYPGTGAAVETGDGDGEGFTVNVPMPAGCGDDEYLASFDEIIIPVVRAFAPEFVMVSAGFDAHRRDPLAEMRVSDQGFAALATKVLDVAGECAGGRCVAVLEGGYSLDALRDSVQATLEVFAGGRTVLAATAPDWLGEIKREHARHWPGMSAPGA